MTEQTALGVIRVGFALAAIWTLYMAWRAYRADAVKAEFFEVRDRLFDLAAAGEIDFNHPAYRGMWFLLNALIHFSGRLTLGLFIIPFALTPRTGAGERAQAQWRSAVRELPAAAREKLEQMDDEVSWLVARHLCRRSLPILPVVAIAEFCEWCNGGFTKLTCYSRDFMRTGAQVMEDQAIASERARIKRTGGAIAA